MTYGVYEVTGRRQYRGHDPGTVFEAALPAPVESRAVARGDIKLLRRITPTLAPGSFTLRGWPPPGEPQPVAASTEAPDGASSIEGGGG